MYLPQQFAQTDNALLLEVAQRHSFATLMSVADNAPICTQLPVIVSRASENNWQLECHVARANPHWQALQTAPTVKVLFAGPHVYFSPSLYVPTERVPTWNYISVEVSGQAQVVTDADELFAMQARLIAQFEPNYQAQWAGINDNMRQGLIGAIVGIKIQAAQVQGKFKLNQHRLADMRPEVHTQYQNGSEDEREIAAWMRRLGYWRE